MHWIILHTTKVIQLCQDIIHSIHSQIAIVVSGQHIIFSIFNNRELALGLWITIVAVLLLVSDGTREATIRVIRAATHKKLLTALVCMSLYVVAVVYFLFEIGFWQTYLIKDTIIWFIFSGVVGAFAAIGKAKNIDFFVSTIRDSVSLVLLVEFITNLYSFSLLIEFILIPLVTLIVICSTLMDLSPEFQNPESQPVKRLFTFLNISIGLTVLSHSVGLIFINLRIEDSVQSLKSLLLAPILSVMFLGFTYIFVLWSSYEQIFIRLGFGEKKSKQLIAYIKLRILMYCHVNLNKTNDFWRNGGNRMLAVHNKSDVLKVIKYCKNKGMDPEINP